jgi:hypothetical protein
VQGDRVVLGRYEIEFAAVGSDERTQDLLDDAQDLLAT